MHRGRREPTRFLILIVFSRPPTWSSGVVHSFLTPTCNVLHGQSTENYYSTMFTTHFLGNYHSTARLFTLGRTALRQPIPLTSFLFHRPLPAGSVLSPIRLDRALSLH